MKYFSISILALMVGAFSITSCSKENINKDLSVTQEPEYSMVEPQTFIHDWGVINYDFIGEKHNIYLLEGIYEWEQNNALSVEELFVGIKFQEGCYTDNQIIFDGYYSLTFDEKRNTIIQQLSPNAVSHFISLENIIETAVDYDDLNTKLNQMKVLAQANLSGTDLDIVSVYREVVRNSAYIWYPIELGGSGIGTAYLDNFSDDPAPQFVADWVKRDGLGAGLGMIGWACSPLVGLCIEPTTALASFLYTTISAGVLSSMAG